MALEQERQKPGPLAAPCEEVVLNLLRTHDQFQVRFTRLFRQFGLTPSQYNVLRILRGEGRPLPILEIAARTVTVVPGITGLIDRLERVGFLARRRCQEDRRVIWVHLKRKGLKTLAALDTPLAELNQSLLGHLAAAELKELSRLLEKARQPLGPRAEVLPNRLPRVHDPRTRR